MEMPIESIFVPLSKTKVSYEVKKTGHLKYFDADGYRGIMNRVTEQFNPSFLSVKVEVPTQDFDSTWQEVNPEEIAITPIILTIEISTPLEPQNLVQKKGVIEVFKPNK